jgi:tRNA pseudouridine65 synthase
MSRETSRAPDLVPDDVRPRPLRVLHEDRSLVAVHKPAGHVVHRTRLCPDAPVVLQQLRDQLNCFLYPIHRLDRGTCGVLLFARSSQAAASLAKLFRDGGAEKLYVALVRGWTDSGGEIDHPFREQPGRDPKEARTHYRRLSVCELPIPVAPYATARYSLVAVRPRTGRMHQIRRHMKHLGHPVVGDTTHGRSEHNRMFRERFASHRLVLQALALSFPHPETGWKTTIVDALDPDFAKLFRKLGVGLGDLLQQPFATSPAQATLPVVTGSHPPQ